MCHAFVEAGAHVRALDAVAPPEPSPSIESEIVDVTSDDQLRQCFDAAAAPWAVVNVVGGFAPARDLTEFDVEEFDEQVRLNLTTAALVTKHALRRMSETGQGRLVHTASRAALQIEGAGFAYSAQQARRPAPRPDRRAADPRHRHHRQRRRSEHHRHPREPPGDAELRSTNAGPPLRTSPRYTCSSPHLRRS